MGLGWLVGGRVALARRSSGHIRSELLAVELIEEDCWGGCDDGFGQQSGRWLKAAAPPKRRETCRGKLGKRREKAKRKRGEGDNC